MRVLILNQYALPKGEAGITRHGDIGAELVNRGHDVTIIASDFDYFARRQINRPKQSVHDGVRFVWLQSGSYSQNDSRRVASMARYAAGAAWAAIRLRPRPDVIIGSSPHLLAAASARFAAGMLRRPWVFEVRDFWPSALVDLGAIKEGGGSHRALLRLERHLYVRADAIVSVPPNGHRRLAELGIQGRRVVHIPNSTVLISRLVTDPPETLLSILEEIDGKFVFAYTGALGVTHDFPGFLAALAHLRSEEPDLFDRAAFLLVGDGVERQAAENMARELRLTNVHFHDSVPKAAIQPVLKRADAGLMLAGASAYFRYGLSPNKLFDYFASGLPVLIGSAFPTVADEVGAGIRYEPGNPVALASAMGTVMTLSSGERSAMGSRGRELIESRYSAEVIASEYEALLRSVVAGSRG